MATGRSIGGREVLVYGVVLAASVGAAVALMLPRLLHPHVDLRPMPKVAPFAVEPSDPVEDVPTAEAALPAPAPTLSVDHPLCPSDMVFVHGAFCPFVAHQCDATRKGGVCERFKSEVLCEGTIREARFCVDRYEYPNERGAKPVVLVDFEGAKDACEAEGKRLCTVDEWQYACEGAEMLPLPNGLARDGTCNVDRPEPTSVLGAARSTFEYAAAVMRVDGRAPSGSHPACASPWGVVDLVGNVAEWAENPAGSLTAKPFHSAVLGGSSGAGEAKCRSTDFSVPDNAASPRVGFRCCVDAGPRPTGERALPSRRSPGGFRPIGKPATR